MQKVKIVYFGTPDFSARFLQKILDDVDLPVKVIAVVTQPDKKVGRKQILTPTPVKELALRQRIPVLTESKTASSYLKQSDLGLLFAYGKLVSQDVLNGPKCGFWNLHPSLLPKYRGPSPVSQALIDGAVETGVTIIKMDSEMDHGPILAQQTAYVFPVWRQDQLMEHLIDQGYVLLKQLLTTYCDNLDRAPLIEQDHTQVTYTKLFEKEDGFVAWQNLIKRVDEGDKTLFNLYRGLYPWPGIWSKVKIKDRELRIKITKIHLEGEKLVIKAVQLEGKKETDFDTFRRAYSDLF